MGDLGEAKKGLGGRRFVSIVMSRTHCQGNAWLLPATLDTRG